MLILAWLLVVAGWGAALSDSPWGSPWSGPFIGLAVAGCGVLAGLWVARDGQRLGPARLWGAGAATAAGLAWGLALAQVVAAEVVLHRLAELLS